jgi:predicted GNAT family N-acyltransferase
MKYKIIDKLNERQKDDLFQLYKNEFWSNQRRREDIDKVLTGSNVIVGLEDESGNLIGFCRVLTDYIYKAVIFDVIVSPEHRSKGLGQVLMNTVMGHQDLQQVEQFALNCLPEMLDFYRRWGFTDNLGDTKFMRYSRKI